jgi:hypothetical protein
VFAFIDIEDIEIVRAEGPALGPEQRDAAVRAALASVPLRLCEHRAATRRVKGCGEPPSKEKRSMS